MEPVEPSIPKPVSERGVTDQIEQKILDPCGLGFLDTANEPGHEQQHYENRSKVDTELVPLDTHPENMHRLQRIDQ